MLSGGEMDVDEDLVGEVEWLVILRGGEVGSV